MIARRVSADNISGANTPAFLTAKILDEKRRDMSGGVGDRRGVAALLADLVERWEHRVRANQQMLILLCAVF